jgi:hypothetical protein
MARLPRIVLPQEMGLSDVALGDCFELADSFLGKTYRYEGPDQRHDQQVSKNTPGDPVYGSNRNGTQRHEHTGGDSAGRLAEILFCARAGLLETRRGNAHGREGRQHSEAGNQRPAIPRQSRRPQRDAPSPSPAGRGSEPARQ